MCTNYDPVPRHLLQDVFGVDAPPTEWKPETLPGDAAPIVRADAKGRRECIIAGFGLMQRSRSGHGARSFETMNAPSEKVGERCSCSGPWYRGQLCLVPATAIYELNYDAGPQPSRYKIWLPDELAFGIAALWRAAADGSHSFTMLTTKADHHPVMSRLHAPGKAKRGVVIVPRARWDAWLTCRDPDIARSFMTLYPAGQMATEPAPVLPGLKGHSAVVEVPLPISVTPGPLFL
ncbi:hypothetical protein BJN34_28900 [Cupriavidus necator]|uniref:Abasic site processing protein n=1 Tax=Cupriavidus necator TaxID=106590 RepID=A0A1U9UYT1_CUPNE|nr:SOS response-associated peptidase family protein [Cupriavidus necator]AQV97888.1 hypothetical protein BJN34_28900 [Cupriavidus necator]